MSGPNTNGNIQIAVPGDTKFSNASDGDMCIYTDTNQQKIHLGTLQNAVAAMTLSNQVVSIPQFYSPGSVVQVVYNDSKTAISITSTALIEIPLNVYITPKFPNSALIAVANIQYSALDTAGIHFDMRMDGLSLSTNSAIQTTAGGINRPNQAFWYKEYAGRGRGKISTTSKFLPGDVNQHNISIWCASHLGAAIEVVSSSDNFYGRSDIVVYEIAG